MYHLAKDANNNLYVTGKTSSANFPLNGAGQPGLADGLNDSFVSKLNAAGNALLYSTYLGGSDEEEAYGIAVDANGGAYVAGWTWSSDFPTTAGAFQTLCNSCPRLPDGFVSKLNTVGSATPTPTATNTSTPPPTATPTNTPLPRQLKQQRRRIQRPAHQPAPRHRRLHLHCRPIHFN